LSAFLPTQRKFVELYFCGSAPVFLSQNRRFQFQKRSQYFIGMDNETLSIVAVSVNHEEICLSTKHQQSKS